MTQEQLDIIMKKPYISSTKLSKELNIPASTIRRCRNNNGIKVKDVFNPDINEFIAVYDDLKSARKVGEHFHVSHKTVLSFAQKIGYDPTNSKIHLSEQQIDEIVSCYYTHTSTVLAKQYNVSISTICAIWTKHGLKGKRRRVYAIDENYFETIDTQEKAYFLGFIASDGCIYNSKKQNKQNIIQITIHKQDKYILEQFAKLLKTDKPIKKLHGKYASLEIVSDKMVQDLLNLGLGLNKTYGNTIPSIPRELEMDFVRGYIDGDGHISPPTSNNMRVGISGYKNNLNKIAHMFESRNVLSCFFEDKRNKKNPKNNDCFGELSFCNKLECYCVLKLLYHKNTTLKLTRKYSSAQDFINKIENSDKKSDKEIQIYFKNAVQALI